MTVDFRKHFSFEQFETTCALKKRGGPRQRDVLRLQKTLVAFLQDRRLATGLPAPVSRNALRSPDLSKHWEQVCDGSERMPLSNACKRLIWDILEIQLYPLAYYLALGSRKRVLADPECMQAEYEHLVSKVNQGDFSWEEVNPIRDTGQDLIFGKVAGRLRRKLAMEFREWQPIAFNPAAQAG